ncbi:MAG: iron uptake porin, partial [Pseudanabaena sp.]
MAKVWSQQVQVSLVGAIAISGIGVGASASAQSQQLTSVATQDVIGLNVTSVSQLSDVRPTDWAFTALQSLIERYGCIAGYPDRTCRGNQATSRYEFAAGLNACLDKINEIISAGLADKVGKEDLATLQK